MSRSGVARVDFYFEDWLTGTFEMPAEARGVFITICALIWKTGDRLKDDDRTLARWNAMKVRRWCSVKDELIAAGKIRVENGFIRQERAAAELQSSQKRREIAQEKGAKGGQKRSETTQDTTANPLIQSESADSPAQPPARVLPPTPSPTIPSVEEGASPTSASCYRFAGKVIKLKEADFQQWETAYHAIDLYAHLTDLDAWLETDATANHRKKWFLVVSASLRKKHQAAIDARKAELQPKPRPEWSPAMF